jgi:hypothetical protein
MARRLSQKRTAIRSLSRENTDNQYKKTDTLFGIRHQTLIRNSRSSLSYGARGENPTRRNISPEPSHTAGQNHHLRERIWKHNNVAGKTSKHIAEIRGTPVSVLAVTTRKHSTLAVYRDRAPDTRGPGPSATGKPSPRRCSPLSRFAGIVRCSSAMARQAWPGPFPVPERARPDTRVDAGDAGLRLSGGRPASRAHRHLARRPVATLEARFRVAIVITRVRGCMNRSFPVSTPPWRVISSPPDAAQRKSAKIEL